MRMLVTVSVLLLISACSTLPEPDPDQAWIDLTPHADTTLDAVQVDERDWQDPRYFEVPPGKHELKVRYQFAVDPSNLGAVEEPLQRDCQLNVSFKDFNAGERYRLMAGSTGLHPWIKLYDQRHKLIGEGLPEGCQRT